MEDLQLSTEVFAELGFHSSEPFALVVQGGGMRGTYSIAVLMALEEMGLSNHFDYVVGSSAGAINGAYFLAGQGKVAVEAYINEISNSHFINLCRIGKIVDIDFLIDEVIKGTVKLEVEKVFSSESELEIALTNWHTGETEYYSTKKHSFDLVESLRATAALPILYNKKIKVNDQYYVDGGITDAVPMVRAIAKGYKNIVVILTRDPGFRRQKPNPIIRSLKYIFMRDATNDFDKVMFREDTLFNTTMELIEHGDNEVNILAIYPSNIDHLVGRTTASQSDLLRCALMARNDARVAFKQRPLNDNPFNLWESKAAAIVEQKHLGR